MKQSLKLIIKPIYLIILFLLISNITTAAIRETPYSGDTKVRHSLYVEKDNQERMSVFPHSIPLPKEE